MRRRRRRPRVQWLPNTGSVIDGALAAQDQSAAIIKVAAITFASGNPTTLIETPLVLDNPPEADEAIISLAARQTKALDEESTFGYRLRRIVGELFVGARAESATPGAVPSAILVQAGIIVRRVLTSGNSTTAGDVGFSDPGSISNNEDPWIWRRDWILGPINKLVTAGTSTLLPAPDAADQFNLWANVLPETNQFTTGPNNTSTVDTKIARRIGAEERLFLDVAFTRLGFGEDAQPPAQGATVFIVFPYRVLATLSLTAGNRKNASR